MDYNEQMELAELISEAKSIDKDVIERLPNSSKFQFARVRDDVELCDSSVNVVMSNQIEVPSSAP